MNTIVCIVIYKQGLKGTFPFCHVTDSSVGSALPAQLVEQASLKQSELDAHPVRCSMKELLRSLDQLCPFEPDGGLARPDYVRSFFDYINTLASVVVRSLGSEGKIYTVWGKCFI